MSTLPNVTSGRRLRRQLALTAREALVGTVVRAGVVGFVADGFVRVGAGELRSKEESVKIEESR
jgi:hypothetical protein